MPKDREEVIYYFNKVLYCSRTLFSKVEHLIIT